MMTGRVIELPIEKELKDSYLTYAMSVIVSRALPDVRDGLKPSQRRILVAMNDLDLTPGAAASKCAKIFGDTSGNYHPHGDSGHLSHARAHGPGLEHAPRADRQAGQFRLDRRPARRRHAVYRSPHVAVAALMLDDLKLDTVDYLPTYDEQRHRADGSAVEVSEPAGQRLATASRSAWPRRSRRTTWAKSATPWSR